MRLHEITKPNQIKLGGFSTNPPDPEWVARWQELSAKRAVHDNAETEQLKQILLRYGGWAAGIEPDDPDLTKLIERGIIMTGRGAKIKKGKPINCHCNAAGLWIDGLARICTGYALSRDGMWRQHSWGLTQSGQIIETTVGGRVAYFGVILTDEESKEFVKHNPPR